MKFIWDEDKAAANLKKHKVSFEEAREVFLDEKRIEFFDGEHSTQEENRYNVIGLSSKRLLFTVYIEIEEETIRIISARKAEKKYRELYEQDEQG